MLAIAIVDNRLRRMTDMNILYICNGNVARSQEAELFTNTPTQGKHHAQSAGIEPRIGPPIDPMVVKVMREAGFDMNSAFRKPIDKDVGTTADVIASFKPVNELPHFMRSLPNLRYWDVADPRGESIEFHRKTRDIIRSKVELLLGESEARHGSTDSHPDR